MASKAMWEVDPETRSKLAAIQKESKNNVCCDCNAPSPQWASPKFGVFICLSCAGVHRGLGVHISFVRSISMDAFKASEIERMRLGGNDNWRAFFDEHDDTQMRGISWDDATIAERYGGEVGEEYKERLTCKVEGKDYVPGEKKPAPAPVVAKAPMSGSATSRAGTPLSGTAHRNGSRSQSPAQTGSGKVKVDDKYFAKLGADNASRPDDLPPNQGGKYAGFGNMPASSKRDDYSTLPRLNDLQQDPWGAFSTGLGWFASTVTKTAKTVNDGYIQPTATKFAEGDFAKQAQLTASQLAKQAQVAGKNAQEGFNRFVEGGNDSHSGRRQVPLDESKADFWDSFSSLADQKQHKQQKNSSIGTSAMGVGKKGSAAPAAQKKNDEWDDW
ncbi:hypothetical protein MY1884_003372 [Beauveria asiatica]